MINCDNVTKNIPGFVEELKKLGFELDIEIYYTEEDTDVYFYPQYRIRLSSGGIGRENVYVCFTVQQWPSLCATVIMSSLSTYGTFPDEVVEVFSGAMVEFFHTNKSYHNMVFAGSLEETSGRAFEFLGKMGFVRETEHISTRTNHQIVKYNFVMASKDEEEHAIASRERYQQITSSYAAG